MKTPALMNTIERARYERFLTVADERLAQDREYLSLLRTRLSLSSVAGSDKTPSDLAVMYSQVRVRNLASGRTHVQTVALPTDAELLESRRPLSSWPAPLLLGAREGDEVQWLNAGTLERLRIEEVLYQPRMDKLRPGSPSKEKVAESMGRAACVTTSAPEAKIKSRNGGIAPRRLRRSGPPADGAAAERSV